MQESRTQRRSDGTLTVRGVRFEVPGRYRTLQRVQVRYARWDLSYVLLCDPRSQTVLCRLYPLDKTKNAEGRRCFVRPAADPQDSVPPCRPQKVAPLLEKLMTDYAAMGLVPAYLPKDDLPQASDDLPSATPSTQEPSP